MKFIRNNSLSIVFILLFAASFAAQVYFGFKEYNADMAAANAGTASLSVYLHSGHFIESTFENWESEFLQMALLVILSIFLKQKGSSESKGFGGKEEVDREPSKQRKNVPWPVKKGGVVLQLYKYSLSVALMLLFIISFFLHFYGSLKAENHERLLKGEEITTAAKYISGSRFWFESFQNWQSEFLSVFTLIVFSIYLRQKGSPQSKPVDAPHAETGE